MADVEKININNTDYDISDAKALHSKGTEGANSFVDSKAGNTTYPTEKAYQYTTIIGDNARIEDNSAAPSYVTLYGYSARSNNAGYTTSVGANSQVTGSYATALGFQAQATNSCSTAIGGSAQANGQYSNAIGYTSFIGTNNSYCNAIGYNAQVTGSYRSYSNAIGGGAVVNAGYATQLGDGTNNDYGTLQFRVWKLLDSNGIIPSDRLPVDAKFATTLPMNLYSTPLHDYGDDNVKYAMLYLGETNPIYTNNLCYESQIKYSYPSFNCTWFNTDFGRDTNDVMVDQQKLFEKLAEVSQERIDDNDVANSCVGGDNATMGIYFYYNGDSQTWRIEFGDSSIESGDSDSPASIEGITDITEYGIYLSQNVNLPTEDSDEEIFDIEYYAPVYCDGISYDNNYFKVNYMKLMSAMDDSDWGFGTVISNLSSWGYEVGEQYYSIPILPKTYTYNGDEYEDITVRFEWDNEYTNAWGEYINGSETPSNDWNTSDLANIFGIYIDSGAEEDVSYLEFVFRPARQLSWVQFNPVDESDFASAEDMTTALADIATLKGWSLKTIPTSNIDLNNYTDDGWYRFTGSSIANRPVGLNSFFDMYVINNENNIKQFIFASNMSSTVGGAGYGAYAPSIFHRVKYYNTWYSWQTVLSNYGANFISQFDSTKQQKLVHGINDPMLKWVEDTGGGGSESSRNIGEIIASTIPLTDAGLHLLDGALISGSGSYSDFVTYIAGLVSTYPDLFETEANWQSVVTTYGVCGKFVYDSVNNTVRLPKITGFIEGASGTTTLGDLVEAGLPNITGGSSIPLWSGASLSGAFYKGSNATGNGWYNTDTAPELSFDASKSSSVYGNSNTVQPQAIKVLYYIVIATSTKTSIEVDIDEIATDLNGKADRDLTNLTNGLTNTICTTKPTTVSTASSATPAVVVENYVNGTSWYRIYSDGWCEQGGFCNSNGEGNFQTALLVNFVDTNYIVNITFNTNLNSSATSAYFYGSYLQAFNKTTSSFYSYCSIVNSSWGTAWRACGYIR